MKGLKEVNGIAPGDKLVNDETENVYEDGEPALETTNKQSTTANKTVELVIVIIKEK